MENIYYTAATTTNLTIGNENFYTSYLIGTKIDLSFKVFLNEYDASSSLINQTELTKGTYQTFVDNNEVDENYVFNSLGNHVLSVKYNDYVSQNYDILCYQQGNMYLYYAIVAVVVIFAIGMGIFIRKKKRS